MMRVFLAFALLLAGCAPEPASPERIAADAAKAAADALPVYRVAVAKDGLLFTDPRGGGARPAPFGLRQSLLLAILARSFGAAAEGHDAGCDQDFARWPNGLTLWFDGGNFAGWSLAGEDAAIGAAPGMVRAPVMAAGVACTEKGA